MSGRFSTSRWRLAVSGLVALLVFAGPAKAQEKSSKASEKVRSSEDGAVVRTFGSEGGYRTELKSRTTGKLTTDDLRQASLLMAQVFQHIAEARDKIDEDGPKEALKEVNKARDAIKAVRSMLPRTEVHTRTLAPDGKAIYEDDREDQPGRIPLYEGILHRQTLEPILAARRTAMEFAGYRLVDAETIATEVVADVDSIETQLTRAAKALEHDKTAEAAKALATAMIHGLSIQYNKDDSPLTAARDGIWMARRSLEENNSTQALANLETARLRLQTYRGLLSEDQRQEVDQMLRSIEQLEGELRQEGNRSVTGAERARQGTLLTKWWDGINGWFHRYL
ncbi:YfdX family protein [Aquisphaera insulae]|uniref:YfdX family protein n=1 Tax=Aquisphaera insulae TaxID=2712864 RepID=UPI0013EA89EE|nr:YfdX family protein [Aquisphaera insulae]